MLRQASHDKEDQLNVVYNLVNRHAELTPTIVLILKIILNLKSCEYQIRPMQLHKILNQYLCVLGSYRENCFGHATIHC